MSYDIQGTAGAINGGAIGAGVGGYIGKKKGKPIRGALIGAGIGAGAGAAYGIGSEYLMRRNLSNKGFEFDKYGNMIVDYGYNGRYKVSVGRRGESHALHGHQLRDNRGNFITKNAFLPRLGYYYKTGNDIGKYNDTKGRIYVNVKMDKYDKDRIKRSVAHEVGHLHDDRLRYGVPDQFTKERRDIESYADRYAVEVLGQDPKKLLDEIRSDTYRSAIRSSPFDYLSMGKDKFRQATDDIDRKYRGTWLEDRAMGRI